MWPPGGSAAAAATTSTTTTGWGAGDADNEGEAVRRSVNGGGNSRPFSRYSSMQMMNARRGLEVNMSGFLIEISYYLHYLQDRNGELKERRSNVSI